MSVDEVGKFSREETEETLGNARKRTAEALGKLLAAYHEVIDKKPESFMRLVCEGILDIHNEYLPNPFLDEEQLKGVRRGYSDMAALILKKLDKDQSTSVVGEYVSLENWINDHAGKPYCPPKRKFNSPKTNDIAWSLVLALEDYFGHALQYAYEFIYHGVPIYTFDEALGSYEMISFSNEDYVFMSRLGRHPMDIRTGHYPEWIKRYSFKGSDLAAHDIFFRGELPDESGIEALRDAYRRHLFPDGVRDKMHGNGELLASINSQTHANLLRAIADFPSHYPGSKSRKPKLDADVRPWLKSGGYASSDREAHVFGSILAEQFNLSADT